MKVTVRYTAQLREAAGAASEVVDLANPPTVAELVKFLADRHGDGFRAVAFGASGRPAVLIVVGETQVRSDDPRKLADGVIVSLLAPISGG